MKRLFKILRNDEIPAIISFSLIIFIFIFSIVLSVTDAKKYNTITYYRGEVISKIQKITKEDTLYWIEVKQYNEKINGWNFFKLKVNKFNFNKIKLGRRLNPNKINEKIN